MQDAELFETTVAFMPYSLNVLQRLCEARLRKPDRQAMLYREIACAFSCLSDAATIQPIHTVCTLMAIKFLLGNDKHIGG